MDTRVFMKRKKKQTSAEKLVYFLTHFIQANARQ